MGKVELDTIRRLLQGALQNLNEGAVGDSAPIAVLSAQGESEASGSPIIVVVTTDPKLRQVRAATNRTSEPLNTIAPECGCHERKVSHPGLERFTIETDTQTAAPKSCFMEPSRLCVNSGACEMRGF
jgi:hypothetical protein